MSKFYDGYLEDVVDFQDRTEREKRVTNVFTTIHPDDFVDQGQEVSSQFHKKSQNLQKFLKLNLTIFSSMSRYLYSKRTPNQCRSSLRSLKSKGKDYSTSIQVRMTHSKTSDFNLILDKKKRRRTPSPISQRFNQRLNNVLNHREELRENLQLEREIEELKTCTFTPALTNTSRLMCHQRRKKPIYQRYE